MIREFNRIRSSLPPDITQIDIRKDSPGLVSIVQMALVSDTASWRELKEKAENLKDMFESVPGVRTARRGRSPTRKYAWQSICSAWRGRASLWIK